MVNFLVRLFLPRGLGLTILLSLMTSSHAENYPMPPIEVGKGLFALSTPVVDEVKPRHVRYLIEDHPMSLEEVVALDSEKWSRLKLRSLSFGRGSRPVWIHLSIANLAPHIQERLVELRWTNMHQVAFYSIPRVQNEDGSESLNINELVSYKTGLETLPGTDEKSGPFHLFPLTLEAQAQVEIFLRVQSDYLLFTPLKIWPVDQYTDYEQSYVSVHALFFGMFLSLLLYNL
ncbi:MAG: 7TMR-DISMED2 domain-containing protein, partial [Oceanobacter sp.]